MNKLVAGNSLFFQQSRYVAVHEGAFLDGDRFALQVLYRLGAILLADEVTDLIGR
ncbi:hypothetical protein D3C72_2515070 [compost metagenome]